MRLVGLSVNYITSLYSYVHLSSMEPGCYNIVYCIKTVLHTINSHVLTGTNQCINKAIHVLLIHGLAVLRISIPGPQKLTSSSVTCSVTNIILWRQDDVSLYSWKQSFQNVCLSMALLVQEKKNFSKHFLRSFRVFVCNNSNETCFCDTLISAGPLGRCGNPRLSGSVSTLPSGPSRC